MSDKNIEDVESIPDNCIVMIDGIQFPVKEVSDGVVYFLDDETLPVSEFDDAGRIRVVEEGVTEKPDDFTP